MRAAIFDMDGLLIDSEPLWREAEAAVFATVGIELTGALSRETVGLRVDAAVAHWYRRFGWSGPTCEQVTHDLLDAAESLIVSRGRLMEGAAELTGQLRSQGLDLAIASSSPLRLIRAVVEKFGLHGRFAAIHSAETETAGKPDPAVYRTVIARLGVRPRQCIAFEDSLAGIRAAKSAGTTVVAVPAAEDMLDPRFAKLADRVIGSLRDFSLEA